MGSYIKAISPRSEFTIVVLVAFGYFMLSSILAAFIRDPSPHISQVHLQTVLIYELVMIAVLWKFLSLRAWNLKRLGFLPTVNDTAIGFGLAIVGDVSYVIVWIVAHSFFPGLSAQAGTLVAPNLGLITVLVVSVVNPIFEEVFVCGYVITALKESRGLLTAINVSVAIRLTYHLYQGQVGIISIVPLGLLFAYWFSRTGRLWPVIVAHSLLDLFALLPYVSH